MAKAEAGRGGMTVADAGAKGGRQTKKRHGPEFFQTIGRAGGSATKERYGPQFYEKIGKKGGAAVRRLVKAGKKATQ